jgi:hypothetical protein
MSEKYGAWHKLEVGWWEPINDTWKQRTDAPPPEDIDGEVDWDYVFTHPAECGHGCFYCGSHQTCGIDYDVVQIGIHDALGQAQPAPGLYAARHVLEVSVGLDGREVSTWIELDPAEPGDSRFEGLAP